MALIQTPEGQSITDQMTAQDAAQAPAPVLAPAAPVSDTAGSAALSVAPTNDVNALPNPTDAALQLRLNAPAPGSFGSKLSKALDQTPLELKPNGKPAPGAWARSLVGAAQGVLSGLGDVSTEKVPPGSGALGGIARTLANRNKRLQQQAVEKRQEQHQDEEERRANERWEMEKAQNQLNNANALKNSIAIAANAHRTNTVEPHVAADTKMFNLLTDPKNARPAEVVKEGLTSDQAKQWVLEQSSKDPKFTTADYQKFATGIQTDDAGNSRETFSIIRAGGPVTLTDSDKDIIDMINKYAPQSQPLTVGQQISSTTLNTLYRQAGVSQQASIARDKAALEVGVDEDKLKNLKDFKDPRFSSIFLNAMNTHNQNPARAAATIDAKLDPKSKFYDPAFAKAFPNADDVLREHFRDPKTGDDLLDKWRERQAEEEEKAREKAAGQAQETTGIPMTNEMTRNIASLPADKRAVLGAIKDSTLQATMYSLAQNDGSLDLDRIFPNRIYKGSQHMTMDQAVGVLKQLNPNFDEQTYKAMSKQYAALTNGKAADAIGQYNNVLQHSAELADTLQALNANRGPKFWNTERNKMAGAGWGDSAAAINAAIEPLKDEFELLMSGGYKPQEEMQEAYNQVLSQGSTPGQIHAALVKLATTGGIRLENIDQNYYRLAGRHVPDLVTPDALAAAEHIGLNNPQGGDPQAYQRLKTLAGKLGATVFTSGIPAEQNPNTAVTSATMPKPAVQPSVPHNVTIGGKTFTTDASGMIQYNGSSYKVTTINGKDYAVPVQGAK